MKTSDLSRACLRAFVDKSRAAAEALIAPDFRFTSPLDNGLDRAGYFAHCWPGSAAMRAAEVIEAVDDGDRAFVVYEVVTELKRFRNCELHRARDGRLVAVEVFFGWELPHPAPAGGFIEQQQGAPEPAVTRPASP